VTPYSTLYDSFLSKITDYDLISQFDDDLETIMHKYLIGACAEFTQCKQDLTNRDDTLAQFNVTLTDLEIKIISTIMINEWLNPLINNIMLLKQYLSSSDFKAYSQSAHLKEIQSLKYNNQDEVEKLIGRYSYTGDLKSIFGS
jgi:hypothetical protein